MRPYLHLKLNVMDSRRLLSYLKIVLLFLTMILLVVVRVLFGSHQEFQKAEKAFLEARYPRALVHYERAIRYYLPLNPYASKSVERIWQIVNEAKKMDEDWLIMEALRSLKGSLYATQHTIAHNDALIRKVEDKMKALGSPLPTEMDREFPSDPSWSLLTLFGFFCWLGSMGGFIFKGLGKVNKRRGTIIMAWFAIICLGYILWLWGMLQA